MNLARLTSSKATRDGARDAIRDQGLFPCEAEIARRLSQTLVDWQARAKILEREGLPTIDTLMGGRYWPGVVAYLHKRYGLTSLGPSIMDGQENFDALR